MPTLLESILNQKGVEISQVPIIVADNNSTDRTLEVVSEFQSKGLSIQVVQGGLPAKARNSGVKISETDYVIFLDADTTIAKDLIAVTLQQISINPKPCYAPFAHDKDRKFPFELMWIGYNFMIRTRLIGNALGGFAVCFEREKFIEIGGFDETLNTHEDIEIGRRLSRSEVGILNTIVYMNPRRFERDGFWSVFWMYTRVFSISLFTKKYNHKSNSNYFNNDFRD